MVPFTGLGLYRGFRGTRWLKNRIKIFEQFVIPSLLAQTNKNFIVWIAWRYEEKSNPVVKEFKARLELCGLKFVHTHSGCPMYDDKYPDEVARIRLLDALHGSTGELINIMGESKVILMTIQPSDDCYHRNMVKGVQAVFEKIRKIQAFGFRRGYVMDYVSKKLAEWNPNTIPPFFTIKFPREVFIDPLKHAAYTGPYVSHEYIGTSLKFGSIEHRGFIVGTHGENISTIFNHPFRGKSFNDAERDTILGDFGLSNVVPLRLDASVRKILMRWFPYGWQKKLRYWLGEKIYARFYEFIRR